MKVLMIHNDYARFSGEEAACEALATLLEQRGHHVVWYRRRSASIGASVGGGLKALACGIHNPHAAREVARLLDHEQPDVVQVQNLYPLVSPSIFRPCRERSVPVVMRCPNYRLFCPSGLHLSHGQLCEQCLGPGREAWCVLRNCEGSLPKSMGYALRSVVARLTGPIVRGVDVFAVLSEFQKRRFVQQGIPESRIAILHNAAPRVPDAAAGLVSEGQTVSFLGRIAHEKAFDELVAAARALPGIPFAVAGDVKQGQEELVTDLPENVHLHGFLEGEALATFIRNTRVFVNPSRWFEGFPNTVATMMAHGKPVVATRIGALPEIVDDGRTGLLYAPGDTSRLAQHIQALWNDSETCRRLGYAGRDKARSEYSQDAVYGQLMAIYEQAGVRKRSGGVTVGR